MSYSKKRILSVVFVFIAIFPLFLSLFTGLTEGWAKSSYITIKFERTEIKGVGTYKSNINYDVEYSGISQSRVTLTKDKKGNVTEMKIDKSGLSDAKIGAIVININPKSGYIYSDKFAKSKNKEGESTDKNGHKIQTYIGYYVGAKYYLALSGDNKRLSLAEMLGSLSSVTVKFGTFSKLTLDSTNVSGKANYVYASNGTVHVVKATTFTGYQVNLGIVSTNNADTSNDRFNALLSALKSFEDLITLVTYFFFGVALFTSILAIMINTVKLSTIPAHPIKRRECLLNYLYSFICIAMLGSIALLTKLLFQSIF